MDQGEVDQGEGEWSEVNDLTAQEYGLRVDEMMGFMCYDLCF